MGKRVAIVGAGINGLVAANYLARAGFDVTILERKGHAGGACTAAVCEVDGKKYEYPRGASVFGMMEEFVFEETGLSKHISIHCPEHPEIVYAGGHEPAFMWSGAAYAQELRERWNETGDVEKFSEDLEKVSAFLRQGYKDAVVPTLQSSVAALGEELTARFITGSAKKLLDYYFTSEATKLYYSLSVIESGPVMLDSAYSAFSIPLMNSGGIFGGQWGYVKGGIWQVPLELDRINAELGVERIFDARAVAATADGTVTYEKDGAEKTLAADYVLFATDPMTAARLAGEQQIAERVAHAQIVGTSGKLVLFFKKPAQWKDRRNQKHFDSAFRYIIPPKTLEEAEKLSVEAATDKKDFAPGLFEIYCEGAGDRELGGTRDYELTSVFFKNLSFDKRGAQLPEVKQAVMDAVLAHVENPEDCFHSILETPKDLSEWFFFPKGNIDDIELSEGQTFFQRTYSPAPEKSFYQFGQNPRFFYCAAGAYPCGSVAGTPGYMCAQQLIRGHA